jgi:hypothetical protein
MSTIVLGPKDRSGMLLWVGVGATFLAALNSEFVFMSRDHPHGWALFLAISLAAAAVAALVRAIRRPTLENKRYLLLFSLCMLLFTMPRS